MNFDLPTIDVISSPGKSSRTEPLVKQLLSSKSECSERVATWGLDQRPPFSTSSSNLSQRAASFHSELDCSSSISQKSWCGRWSSSSSSILFFLVLVLVLLSASPIENVTGSVSCDTLKYIRGKITIKNRILFDSISEKEHQNYKKKLKNYKFSSWTKKKTEASWAFTQQSEKKVSFCFPFPYELNVKNVIRNSAFVMYCDI